MLEQRSPDEPPAATAGEPSPSRLADRISAGIDQNSTNNGAIVPFHADTNFSDPSTVLDAYGRTKVAELLNTGHQLTPYLYYSADDLPIFVTLRLQKPGETKKLFLPLRCERVIGCVSRASLRHIEGLRPLYNLHKIAARPGATVLFSEGEKAADAAQRQFPAHVSTTWPGGANSVGKVDLEAVAGRDVRIWPDNDSAGMAGSKKLAAACLAAGAASCRIVRVPADFPPKWDLADAEEAAHV